MIVQKLIAPASRGMGDVRIGVAPTARSAATAHVLVREKNNKKLQKNENWVKM